MGIIEKQSENLMHNFTFTILFFMTVQNTLIHHVPIWEHWEVKG